MGNKRKRFTPDETNTIKSIKATLRLALSNEQVFEDWLDPALDYVQFDKMTPAEMNGALLLAKGLMRHRRSEDRRERGDIRDRAAEAQKLQLSGLSKAQFCEKLVSEMNAKMTTKELVSKMMHEAGMTEMGARVYVFNARKKLGLIVEEDAT